MAKEKTTKKDNPENENPPTPITPYVNNESLWDAILDQHEDYPEEDEDEPMNDADKEGKA
ncbi:hypothetical protein ACE38W_15645 [Chitinophaga sp. Hz27]|uniref:hypothetical protein n=1 Tax=Chitinophaga sp. Hz27 TaxID=3347169 RepID=UPI0035DB5411